MPTRPEVKTMTKDSVDVLNAIRNSASPNYRSYVPAATHDPKLRNQRIREIGNIMMDYTWVANEFLNALVNRIGRVLVNNKMYTNPLAIFKQGTMDFGETVEDVFVDLCKPHQYDPAVAEKEIFKREIPDVRSVFHTMNFQKFYKVTVQSKDLKMAFLSVEGVNDLISKITSSMYASAAYDELLVTKYMIARSILNGYLYPVDVPATSKETASEIITRIKGISNDFTFMKRNYNTMGVANFSDKQDQYLLVNSAFDAVSDVEVLAKAFNMDKAQFDGHNVLIDSFGDLDAERLGILFADDPDYVAISAPEAKALKAIPAILVDKKWFMIFDNMMDFTDQFNGEGLYWQYWYHTWKTFSTSPFANSAVFVPGVPAVTNVTVSPSSANVDAGQAIKLNAKVTTENFASKSVVWSTNKEDGTATVDAYGNVTLSPEANGSVIVTATSVFNPEQSGTCTITVNP